MEDECCDFGFGDLTTGITCQRPAYISKVRIEEIDSDLLSGVLTRLTIPPIYTPRQRSNNYFFETGNYIVNGQQIHLNSTLRIDDVEDLNAWVLVNHSGLTKVTSCGTKIKAGPGAYSFQEQVYTVEVENVEQIPYLQFVCAAQVLRYEGTTFHRGDLITVYVKHDKYIKDFPHPPILSVVPNAPATYLMPLPRQVVQILVPGGSETEMVLKDNCPLAYSGRKINGKPDCVRVMNGPLQFEHYTCLDRVGDTRLAIVVRVQGRNNRMVFVPPYLEKHDCSMIFDPGENITICGYNLDEFLIRFFKKNYVPIQYQGACRQTYHCSTTNFVDIKIKILEPKPSFDLSRHKDKWILK